VLAICKKTSRSKGSSDAVTWEEETLRVLHLVDVAGQPDRVAHSELVESVMAIVLDSAGRYAKSRRLPGGHAVYQCCNDVPFLDWPVSTDGSRVM
jgi:hypothetical protein